MKFKIEYLILFVVILGVSIYLVYSERDETHYRLPETPAISAEEISKLEISKQDTPVILEKRNDDWYIMPQDYPADTEKVKTMLQAIEDLSLTALVSESGSYQRYDLHPDKKITVTVWKNGSSIQSFAIGKTAPSFRHTFVSIQGDDNVYHAMGNFRNDFNKTVAELRDKMVLIFNTNDIQEVTVTTEGKTTHFKKNQVPVEVEVSEEAAEADSAPAPQFEVVWETEDGRKGDKKKIDRFLQELSRLSCDSYVDDAKKADYTEAIYTVRLKGIETDTLSIFAKEGEDATRYPATSSQNGYPFHLRQGQAENLMKEPETLVQATTEPGE